MQHFDIIIIGGGPAGSSCAWRLKDSNKSVLLIDKAPFPRLKLCAGWITAKVMSDLNIQEADYPHGMIPLQVKTHLPFLPMGMSFFPTPYKNYSIRRVEFDHWLLKRSEAATVEHTVRSIEFKAGVYNIDDQYSCDQLIGAGGTLCPVRKTFFPDNHSQVEQVITMEKEFEFPQRSDTCHLFFCYKKLQGYSWVVPKKNGYVNIGLGGLKSGFRKNQTSIHVHFKQFLQSITKQRLVTEEALESVKFSSHPYVLHDHENPVKKDGCYLIGDSAGLASIDLGEGIGPAVESGLAAAEEILGGQPYIKNNIDRYSFAGTTKWLVSKVL